jgi:hypothetical protein
MDLRSLKCGGLYKIILFSLEAIVTVTVTKWQLPSHTVRDFLKIWLTILFIMPLDHYFMNVYL